MSDKLDFVQGLDREVSDKQFKLTKDADESEHYNITAGKVHGFLGKVFPFLNDWKPISQSVRAHYQRESANQYLVFAGTDAPDTPIAALLDWMKNLNAIPVMQKRLGARVHNGFARAWDDIRPEVLKTIAKTETDAQASGNPFAAKELPLNISGHSLGGAIAKIAALDFSLGGFRVGQVVTLGAPDVGWGGFNAKYKEQGLDDATFEFRRPLDVVGGAGFSQSKNGTIINLDGQGNAWEGGSVGLFDILLGASAFIPGLAAALAGLSFLGVHPSGNYRGSYRHAREERQPPASDTAPANFQPMVGGGLAPSFALGGPVWGALHSAGGVAAELEGGENVWSRRDVANFGGQANVEALKRLAGTLGASPSIGRMTSMLPSFSFGSGAAHNPVSRGDTHHNANVTVNVPQGTPVEQVKIIEEAARAVFRDELRRSIEHVHQNNPRMEFAR